MPCDASRLLNVSCTGISHTLIERFSFVTGQRGLPICGTFLWWSFFFQCPTLFFVTRAFTRKTLWRLFFFFFENHNLILTTFCTSTQFKVWKTFDSVMLKIERSLQIFLIPRPLRILLSFLLLHSLSSRQFQIEKGKVLEKVIENSNNSYSSRK
jgi:hypothetical protein